MKRPGISRPRVRSPELALRDLRGLNKQMALITAHRLADAEFDRVTSIKPWSLRDWFYSAVRSFCARHMKAGL